MNNENKKIYIVLTQTYTCIAWAIKIISGEKYSHASISLDNKCKNMYSFGRKYVYFPFYGVFEKEHLDKGLFAKNKNSLIAIYELNVNNEQYNQIKYKIKQIEKTNKGYNIIGLLLALFKIKLHRNKYYCSEFVYEVLSSDKVNIYDKNHVIFKPEDLVKNNNFNMIYEGKVKDFILEA